MSRRLGAPRESWLRSNDHERFAAAAVRCRHAGAYCIQDGFCHYGDCFRRCGPTTEERIANLERRVAALEANADA